MCINIIRFNYNLSLNITYKLYSALSHYISCQFSTAGSYFVVYLGPPSQRINRHQHGWDKAELGLENRQPSSPWPLLSSSLMIWSHRLEMKKQTSLTTLIKIALAFLHHRSRFADPKWNRTNMMNCDTECPVTRSVRLNHNNCFSYLFSFTGPGLLTAWGKICRWLLKGREVSRKTTTWNETPIHKHKMGGFCLACVCVKANIIWTQESNWNIWHLHHLTINSSLSSSQGTEANRNVYCEILPLLASTVSSQSLTHSA